MKFRNWYIISILGVLSLMLVALVLTSSNVGWYADASLNSNYVVAETVVSPQKSVLTNHIPIKSSEDIKVQALKNNIEKTDLVDVSVADAEPKIDICDYTLPEEPEYTAEMLTENLDLSIEPGVSATKTIQIKNTGNTRWYSVKAGCSDVPVMNLGTQRKQDRTSAIADIAPQLGKKSWLNSYYNRVVMIEDFVDPGQTATFHINFKTPYENNIYREYFAPVIEGNAWLEDNTFKIDVHSGFPTDEMEAKMPFVDRSLAIGNLPEDKNVEIILSKQRSHIKYGDTIVHTFMVSTGARKTPTPQGQFMIHRKQDVRVASAWPHYVMPNYLSLVATGAFGMHALPSLSNDKGIFWTEALNHIGTPVSHGCVRLLPGDSDLMKAFVEVGTPVLIRY